MLIPTYPAALINMVEVASSAVAESPITNQPSVTAVNPVPPLSTSNVPVVSDSAIFNVDVATLSHLDDPSHRNIEP